MLDGNAFTDATVTDRVDRASDGEVLAEVTGNRQEARRAQYQQRSLDLSDHIGEHL